MYTLADFIQLKPVTQTYCGTTYQLKRFISKDKKVLLTFNDKGLSPQYWQVFVAEIGGKFSNDRYLNSSAHPFYSADSALEALNASVLDAPILHSANIHPSHITKKYRKTLSA